MSKIIRLTGLSVNLAGVEIILRMRRRIETMQAEVTRLQVLLMSEMPLARPERPQRFLTGRAEKP